MRASEFPPEQMPSARYPCGNQACTRQSTWPAEELRWSPGNDDSHGTAWQPGFYCGTCQDEASRSGAGEDAPTLAEEMARRTCVVVEHMDDASFIKMQLVGILVCIPFEMPMDGLLEVPLVDEEGKQESSWHLSVWHNWPESECLPGDLVRIEGHIAANGECDPLLVVSRVRLLRQKITGEQRELLMKYEDTVERWKRAQWLLP